VSGKRGANTHAFGAASHEPSWFTPVRHVVAAVVAERKRPIILVADVDVFINAFSMASRITSIHVTERNQAAESSRSRSHKRSENPQTSYESVNLYCRISNLEAVHLKTRSEKISSSWKKASNPRYHFNLTRV